MNTIDTADIRTVETLEDGIYGEGEYFYGEDPSFLQWCRESHAEYLKEQQRFQEEYMREELEIEDRWIRRSIIEKTIAQLDSLLNSRDSLENVIYNLQESISNLGFAAAMIGNHPALDEFWEKLNSVYKEELGELPSLRFLKEDMVLKEDKDLSEDEEMPFS